MSVRWGFGGKRQTDIACVGAQAWFYRCEAEGTGSTIQVNTRDYMGSVGQVYMTERYAAVLSDG